MVDPAPLAELLRAGLLCNDARLIHGQDGWSILGDPTEAALVVLAEKGGLRHEQEAARAPRLAELPFSSERKRMTTVHLVGGERVAYVKGAAEVILPRTTLADEARGSAVAPPRPRWSATRCASSPSPAASCRPTPATTPTRSSSSSSSSASSA